ncbi:MAG: peptidylprolyl isomerase [Chloroflexota bacterium]|nr:peptidylprolyl isomerase [Chloroflexota bacterium]
MRNNPPPTPRRVRSAHESKSAAVRAAAAAPSQRQQSKWQREQHQQRYLYVAVGVLAALVLAIFGGGILYDNVLRANEVVAQVGPDSITASQLLNQVRPAVRSLDAQAKQLGGGANIAQYVDQQKRSLPDQTLNTMIDARKIEQEAGRRSISVSPAELDDRERQTVADFQASTNPTPTPEASPTPDAAGTAEGALAAAAAPTPDLAGTPAPLTTPTAVPTLVQDAYGAALQQLLDKNYLSEAEFRDRLQQGVLREKLQTTIGQEQVPDTQDQVHAREILLASQDEAAGVLAQLQGGADFGQLAQQVSTDAATKVKGGDLGWFARGGLGDKALEDAAFALQPGQLSEVIQTSRGFGLIQLLEHDPARTLPADQLATARQKAFTDWLTTRRSSQDVKLQLTQPVRDWILARIGIRP